MTERRQPDLRIERAQMRDADEIFALYRTLIGTPYSTWTQDYPTPEIVQDDLARQTVFVMRDGGGRIVAAMASIGEDVDDAAPWYPDVKRWAMLTRLGVAGDMQGRGIARRMLAHAMEQARLAGCDGVRFLVGPENIPAQRSYAKLGFDVCGEAACFGARWLCYQKRLAP